MNPLTDHGASVRDLFNAHASRWPTKYQGASVLGWRVTVFTELVRERLAAPGSILDFGCGSGEIAGALAAQGHRVVGCDVAESMLAQARAVFGDSVHWTHLDPAWRSLPPPDASFDAIVSSSVLEYVPDVALVLREWHRLLRPNGWAALTVPDTRRLVRRVERVLAPLVSTRAGAFLGKASPRLGRYFGYLRLSKNRHPFERWSQMAAEHGFRVHEVRHRIGGAMSLLVLER